MQIHITGEALPPPQGRPRCLELFRPNAQIEVAIGSQPRLWAATRAVLSGSQPSAYERLALGIAGIGVPPEERTSSAVLAVPQE